MEIPHTPPATEGPSAANEIYIVTDRLLENYLDDLSIPESSLQNAGTIVDVGSGFSSFVEEVNQKYSATGTRAVGMDIMYSQMAGTDGSFDKYQDNGGRYSPGYGKLHRGASEEAAEEVYKEMYEEVTNSGNYVAGSYEAMPFASGTVDLLVSNNAILNPSRSIGNLQALPEIKRVLKADGEARLSPSYFGWDNETGEVAMATLDADIVGSKENIAFEHRQVLAAFSALQEQGARLWLAGRTFDSEEGPVTQDQTLIIRFDDEVPALDTEAGQMGSFEYFDDYESEWVDVNFRQELVSLNIQQTKEGFSITSKAAHENSVPVE